MKDILDLKDIENYKHDLRHQNMKKNERPFILPDRIIEIVARINVVFNVSMNHLHGHSFLESFKNQNGKIDNPFLYRIIHAQGICKIYGNGLF